MKVCFTNDISKGRSKQISSVLLRFWASEVEVFSFLLLDLALKNNLCPSSYFRETAGQQQIRIRSALVRAANENVLVSFIIML